MQALKYILIAIYIINCLALIIITMLQSKGDQGLSGAIVGGSTESNNFLDRNKGRTKEGKMKRWTVILAVTFVIFTILLSIVYVI